jgi:DNA replication licensing factor MCM3
MDVDVGNTSNDQDVPAERLLHNLEIRLLCFVFVLCLWLVICFPCFCIICRIEAFEAILGQHVLANHVDQMSIDDIEQTVNRESAAPYTRRQVEFILEV